MARRGVRDGDAKERKALDAAVKDAASFLFQIDATPIPAGRAKTQPPDPLKPHYHDHRGRLRKKFDEAGPSALADYELLEMMLFRTIPRRDTKPLAKARSNASVISPACSARRCSGLLRWRAVAPLSRRI